MAVIQHRRQVGLTLIELIIAIVVLGIAAVGILSALSRTAVLNVDPLLRVQSQALAESVMDEILARPFYRPENDPTLDSNNSGSLTCASADNNAKTSVCDYNGLNTLEQASGEPYEGVSGYSLLVTVDPSESDDFSDIAANCAVRINVAVTDPSGATTRLNAYRTSYWEGCT